ncbi:hypothetical protein CC99x_003125 [Candidatus Berkiella cookevillensis]|uniref:Uncharacterized protein n=1 Tax=Candidatus Berkiella cookevillensis TaxID=437022 RepID=A0A0Q9YRB6_9GAMM|nr:hypothetical protein [Candidatus Berkiella cookevillensis]MCS5707890.1 hypothetical protein [Candidatus Berkiella cookevillensis]
MTIKKEELEAIQVELISRLSALAIAAQEGRIEKNEAFYRDQSLAAELLRNVNEAIISFFKTPYWIWQSITDIQNTCRNSFYSPELEHYRSEYLFPFVTEAIQARKTICSNAIASIIKIHAGETEEVAISPFLLSFFELDKDNEKLQERLSSIPLQKFCATLIQELLIDRSTVHAQLGIGLSRMLPIHGRESDIYKEILQARNAFATPRHGPVEFIPSPRLLFTIRNAHSQPSTPHQGLIEEHEVIRPISRSMPNTPSSAQTEQSLPKLKRQSTSEMPSSIPTSTIEESDPMKSVLSTKSKTVVPSLEAHFERLQLGGGKKTGVSNNTTPTHTVHKTRKSVTKK